jgi:hypothetical protein
MLREQSQFFRNTVIQMAAVWALTVVYRAPEGVSWCIVVGCGLTFDL